MQTKKIILVLAVILAVSCVILSVNLISILRQSSYLPDTAVDDIVTILADAGIAIDPDIISTKRTSGTVYVCNSGDYNRTVASLLGQSPVHDVYVIPDGEILILENGARFEFGEGFSFRCSMDGSTIENIDNFDLSLSAGHVSETKKAEIAAIVVEFLDSGSREFENTSAMSVVSTVETVWENAGVYYAFCSRTIDGISIAENYALCTIRGGEVTEAYGSWSFLTLGQSYAAQLSDHFNILFNVKKEIEVQRSAEKSTESDSVPADSLLSPLTPVTISSIELCYSLYYYGGGGDFCLIPCWQVVTDSMGEFIYNAIDSTLYTKN